MTAHEISMILILLGSILMILSILKFRPVIHKSKDILLKSNKKVAFLLLLHQILMVFFLIGYLTVGFCIYEEIQIVSIIFVGTIFLFGALFVLLGIYLQSEMLSSISLQTKNLTKINKQLLQTQDVTIFALAYQAELRDQETGRHIERTSQYAKLLAEELCSLPKYKGYLTPQYISDLIKSAPLHDIGKVGIPDSILKKPGKLTPEEFEIIKNHCEYGTKVLIIADNKLTFQSFLKIAIQMAHSHHEKWNGKGYPRGLKNDKIPLSGRIMALIDVYDALRSERCYKKGLPHDETCKIILEERGEHFDPNIVDAFLNIASNFDEIFNSMAD
ncbi:MAG: HD domain-containing phosphohydrolase [Syntrophales bacterium]